MHSIRKILQRIGVALVSLFVVVVITFILMKAAPGGPFDSERALPADIKKSLEDHYYLNDPIYVQLLLYFKNIINFDFGPSYRYFGSRTVNEIIAESFPFTFTLGALSFFIASIFGVVLGVLSAIYRSLIPDRIITSFVMTILSLPGYLIASGLVLVFSIWLEWFPAALLENWKSLVLPVITLSLRPMALFTRITRSSMLDVLDSDFVKTARAKGAYEVSVFYRHALRNALIPTIASMGSVFASLLTGSFIVEYIFALPGMGKHFVSAVIDRDYALIMGLTIFYGVIVLLVNLVIDVIYTFVDPRIEIK